MTMTTEDHVARATALADVYLFTNQIQSLLESRLVAIQQALTFGATRDQVAEVMAGWNPSITRPGGYENPGTNRWPGRWG